MNILCPHDKFDVDARVRNYLELGEYVADFQVKCAICLVPFQFIEGSIEPGQLALRMKLEPQGMKLLKESS